MNDLDAVDDLARLRVEVRELVRSWRDAGRFVPRCDAWLRGNDPAFTRALAERGLIGINWPRDLGGGGRSNVARLVVTEELLRAGAPVASHWIADRQIGPAIVRYGSPELQQAFLPGISRGEIIFCLGMSETESGSDLASVRTTASQVEGGWRLTGRKIWTSHAHVATHAYVLARTSKSDRKHEGLSEFVVDLAAPGIDVRPILDLRGEHHFNEMTFDDVFVPEDWLLGQQGNGWAQVTEQLAFERGGMERILTTYPLLRAVLDAAAVSSGDRVDVGIALARLAGLRELALSIARALDAGGAPVELAAVTKDLGTEFEGDVNELARRVLGCEADPNADGPERLLADGILATPGTTIRGGTTEVLRSIVAKATTVAVPNNKERGQLRNLADDILKGQAVELAASTIDPPRLWETLIELGWSAVGVPEVLGGAGGDALDLLEFVEATGRHAVTVPLAETLWAAQLLAGAGQPVDATRVMTVVIPRANERVIFDGSRVSGEVSRVPWGCAADRIVVLAETTDRDWVLVSTSGQRSADGTVCTRGTNLAAEPRDRVEFRAAPATPLHTAARPDQIRASGALMRSAAMLGALESAARLTYEYAETRHQFGRPIKSFQAVGERLARISGQLALARVAGARAGSASIREPDVARIAVAAVITARAATEIARHAHQVHGAIGITREHQLHYWTRRLWSWRDEAGEYQWAALLADRLLALDDDGLWSWISEDLSERALPA